MELSNLKTKILNKEGIKLPLIFKYADSKFLAKQYIYAIAKNLQLDITYIENLSVLSEPKDLFEEKSNQLFVLEIDKLTENLGEISGNLIILCSGIEVKDISIDIVDMPKLVNWQIEDYVQARVPGLAAEKVHWLCDVCKYDVYRLEQECNKLAIFPKASQDEMFDEINRENGYSDLSPFTIFALTNALMKKDYATINDILKDFDNIDIEAVGLVTIMMNQLKALIDVQLNPRNTAESLNMDPKRYKAIKYQVGRFTDKQLVDMFEFLTGVDCRLKSGEFSFQEAAAVADQNKSFVEYLVMKLLMVGAR